MRFRPNLVALEDRRVPAALMAGSEPPTPMPAVIHGQYDLATTVEHDSVGVRDPNFGSLYGLNNTGQSGVDAAPTLNGHSTGALRNLASNNTY